MEEAVAWLRAIKAQAERPEHHRIDGASVPEWQRHRYHEPALSSDVVLVYSVDRKEDTYSHLSVTFFVAGRAFPPDIEALEVALLGLLQPLIKAAWPVAAEVGASFHIGGHLTEQCGPGLTPVTLHYFIPFTRSSAVLGPDGLPVRVTVADKLATPVEES
jgi:hypothetical protein